MKLLFSFVIPVYNVEAYLEECVRSIAEQNNDCFEILLVDDGSTDCSGELCDSFASRYPFVRVIHKSNAGPAIARNLGVNEAIGEFVVFVDSDDRVSSGSIQRLTNAMQGEKRDLYFLNGIKFFPKGDIESFGDEIDPDHFNSLSKTSQLEYLASRPKFPNSPCLRVFRRSFLIGSNLRFPEDGRIAEDLGFCLNSIFLTDSMGAVAGRHYEYRQQREGSRTSKLDSRAFFGVLTFIEESIHLLTENRVPISFEARCCMSFVAYEYSILVWMYSTLPNHEKFDAYRALKTYCWVMDFAVSGKMKLIRKVLSVTGARPTSKLLNVYMRMR